MRRRMIFVRTAVTAAAACVMLSGCGTSAGTHLKSYAGNVSRIVSGMASNQNQPKKVQERETTVSTAEALETPGNFTVAEDGHFSFTGVENADFYLIYFCEPDATDDGDDYLYSSDPIYEDGSEQYEGNFADQFRFAYGEYLAKVYAFPELTDENYEKSGAVTAPYTYTGRMDEPEIDYFWNTNDDTLEAVLTNVGVYTYQVYPDEVELTFVNKEDTSDVVTASMEQVNEENASIQISGLSKGASYEFCAFSRSSSEFVTAPETDTVVVEEELFLGDINILSENYTWSDGWATFPRLMEGFHLLSGGNAGTAYGKFRAMSAESLATPVTANSGSDYSYTLMIDFGGVKMSGTLELKSDGTLEYSETGGGPVAAGTITGSWVDHGDGTASLSYVPAQISS